MNEHAYRNLISGKTRGLTAAIARAGLAMMAMGYRCAIFLRNRMFDAGWRTVGRVAVPVISVGNLTTGGTGKTPIVALIVQQLQKSGRSPAIISRGYGAVVGEANDEKRVLERLCPDIPHVQNASRLQAAQCVLAGHSAEVIVMDDGFQHRQFHRDLDIVLIDATNPFGGGHLLPRGLLREPLSSLRRAHVAMITRSNMVSAEQLEQIRRQIARAAPQLADHICQIEFQATGLIDGTGQRFPIDQPGSDPVLLISGIGNPDAFEATCREAGFSVEGTLWFSDHHPFSTKDLHRITEHRENLGAARVITTLKDLVKLPKTVDFVALEITAVFPDENQAAWFHEQLRKVTNTSAEEERFGGEVT